MWFEQSMDGGGQGRSRNAEKNVHPSGLSFDGRTVDAESRVFPQVKTYQQYFR